MRIAAVALSICGALSGPRTLLLTCILLISSCQGLVNVNPSQATTAAADSVCHTNDSDSSNAHSVLDVDRLRSTIAAGRVYQQHEFLSQSQVTALLDQVQDMQTAGAFVPSGLSNTVKSKQAQNFGSQDRLTAVVPWWKKAVQGDYHEIDDSRVSNIALQLQKVRTVLADALNRPTVLDNTLAHECYYSVSGQGSFLPRHMDERHEELKGARGWLLPSRRSLSWLVYLSDANWTLDENGGALRSFPQAGTTISSSSQHEGNLQVGWFRESDTSEPVYMDSWYQVPGAATYDPHCVLYRMRGESERVVLTQPWLNDALQGMSASEFLAAWVVQDAAASSSPTLFLKTTTARQFTLIEDRAAWDAGRDPVNSVVEDVNPKRGSLVVFDSVSVPHQVQEIRKGHRVALAGWFHEETQPFPQDLSG